MIRTAGLLVRSCQQGRPPFHPRLQPNVYGRGAIQIVHRFPPFPCPWLRADALARSIGISWIPWSAT